MRLQLRNAMWFEPKKKGHENDGWKAEINGKVAEKEVRYLVVGNYKTRSPKILEGRALGFRLPYSATKMATDLVSFPFYIKIRETTFFYIQSSGSDHTSRSVDQIQVPLAMWWYFLVNCR